MVARARNPQARAALLMLGSTLGFGMMAVFIRLASASIPTWEIAFFRNAFGLLSLLPILALPVWGKPQPLAAFAAHVHTRQLPRYVIRTAVGIASMVGGFWAIGHLPLAQAISLAYSSPIFVTVAAVLILGERVRVRRWMAVMLGFTGVLVIVQPWSSTFDLGSLVALSAAMLSALVAIQIKQLAGTDQADTIVFWTYMLWVPMSLVPALFAWHWPTGIQWVWLSATGVTGTVGQLLWTHALKQGDVSALTPISYLQLPVVTCAGWLLFGESLDAATLVGAGIILSSTAYIAHREATLARQRRTNAPTQAVEPGN